MTRKYSSRAKNEVKNAMHELKHGTLASGKSGKKVTNPKQAIAIGLAKARKKGARVPAKSSACGQNDFVTSTHYLEEL